MAKVLVSLKIFPSDIDTSMDVLKKEVEKSLPSYASVHSFEEEPIAFGIVALIAHILMPEDKEDGIDGIESSLKRIGQVSNFQTLMVRRI